MPAERQGGDTNAKDLIEALDLSTHPEGGWYRETWRAPAAEGERAAASAVLYVIEPGQRSHWNRIDASEIWLWHSGDPLDVSIADSESGSSRTVRLGSQVMQGEQPQLVIPKGHRQSAEPAPGGTAGFTLISCIVAPAFEFSGFELAEAGWAPGKG
jgi:predicted cupin superfamily sugar epimerase